VVCGTCGQPAEKPGNPNSGINTVSSGSSTSSVTVTRTYRSVGDSGAIGHLGDTLVGSRTYLLGNSNPRKQVRAVSRPRGRAGPVLLGLHPVPAHPFSTRQRGRGSLPLFPRLISAFPLGPGAFGLAQAS